MGHLAFQVLYTEMVTSMAIVAAKRPIMSFAADFDIENPVVLQLGGSCPAMMAQAAVIGKKYGYREFNINVGCPSPRVAGQGQFGASLMLEPALVGRIAAEMHQATGLPTTVKCRIGVDDNDSYENLATFVRTVHEIGGVEFFIIHARKAILSANFSPDDNRKIPPLKYDIVYKLCTDFPNISFAINGGITDITSSINHINNGVAGVMIGRSINDDPFHWRDVDRDLYNVCDHGKPRAFHPITCFKN